MIIGGVNAVQGPYLKYETLCYFKPKHECFYMIIYCLSAACDIFMYIHSKIPDMCIFYHLQTGLETSLC